jgi:TP901 family phage tail tape measure protein
MARAGAARVFFDVVGTFQASKLISDTQSAATVQSAIMADAAANIADSFDEMAEGILNAVAEITDSFYEFERQLVRVRKFYQGMDGETERFAASAIKLGESFAFSGEQALAASARTAQLKQVLESQEAIIEATRAGLLMAAVGEMETEMGMNRLIALAQQTGFMMGNLTKAQYDALSAEQQANLVRGNTLRVLDQLNTVENTSVATMEDITFVLNQFASQANIAGESIGEMAAMSALLLETGEEVSRAGTGLRMIYQRIGNENTDAVKVLQELMGGVDASVITQMKLSDILKEIAPAYQDMTAEQKRNLAVSVAGSRHYVKFLKLMENQERLVELQTSAYNGAYGALDEFSNRAESAVFDMEQLKAITENVRVEIGENLAPAYLQAEEATYHYLSVIRDLSETDFGLDVMTNVIRTAGLYQNLVAPFANVGFQVFNMIIAFRTLGAVQRAMSAETVNQRNVFIENAKAVKFKNQVENEYSVNAIANLGALSAKNRIYRQELVNNMGQVRYYRDELKGLAIAQKNNTETVRIMALQQQEYGATGSYQARIHQYTGQMIYYEAGAMQDLVGRLQVSGEVFAGVAARMLPFNQQMVMYRSLNRQAGIATANFNSLLAQGTMGMRERVQAQRDLTNARREEFNLVNAEYQLLVPLTQAEQNQAALQIQKNNALIQESRVKLGLIRSDILRAELTTGKVDPALRQLLQTEQENIAALQQKNLTLEQGIMASQQADAAAKQQIATNAKSTVGFRASAIAMGQASVSAVRLGLSINSVNRAMMPLTMILPFVVDAEQSMTVMMGGMAAMMMMRAVPAIIAKTSSLAGMNAQQATAIILQGALTGGTSLLAAGLAIAAGYMMVKAFVGDDFLASPLDNLNEFNDGLNTMESSLASMMSQNDAILSGVVDKSFSEIANSADDMNLALADVNAEIKRIGLAKQTASGALLTDLESQEDAAIKAKDSITDLMDAKKRQNALDAALGGSLDSSTVATSTRQDYLFDSTNKSPVVRDMVGDIQLIKTGETTSYHARYIDALGRMHETTHSSYAKAQESLLELEQQYGRDALAAEKHYLDAMFAQKEEAVVNEQKLLEEANAQQLGEMFSFANAREEMFFGQRQNFTGALYKQVSQGGIENLLHKTEIIQTNVFNGMTLPEMVSQVADGVVAELSNRGISV